MSFNACWTNADVENCGKVDLMGRAPTQRSWLVILVSVSLAVTIQAVLPSTSDRADRRLVARILTGPRFAEMQSTEARVVRIVCFVDLQCPSCMTALPMYREVVWEFNREHGQVNATLELRHFPLDPDCNRVVGARPNAIGCKASAVLQAAVERDGSETAIDHALKVLQANPLTEDTLPALLSLDRESLASSADRLSAAVSRDVKLGLTYGVIATPTVFVDGFRVRGPSRQVLSGLLASEEISARPRQ